MAQKNNYMPVLAKTKVDIEDVIPNNNNIDNTTNDDTKDSENIAKETNTDKEKTPDENATLEENTDEDDNLEKDANKNEKQANFIMYFLLIILAFALLYIVKYFLPTSSNIDQINTQETIPDGLEELKDEDDINQETKEKENFAIVSKSFIIRDNKLNNYTNKEFSPAYIEQIYLEEFLSDGDIDGINANDVKKLQIFLRDNGYSVKVDGIFRRETKRALRAFQRAYGLKADGIVGQKTKKLINSIVQKGE